MDDGATWTIDVPQTPQTGSVTWDVPNRLATGARVAVVEVESGPSADAEVVGVLGVSDPFDIQGPLGLGDVPTELVLAPILPTPARGVARVSFALPSAAEVDLTVLDAQGRSITRLAQGSWPAGRHDLDWQGIDARGQAAPSGVYFIRLSAAGRLKMRRLVWLQ